MKSSKDMSRWIKSISCVGKTQFQCIVLLLEWDQMHFNCAAFYLKMNYWCLKCVKCVQSCKYAVFIWQKINIFFKRNDMPNLALTITFLWLHSFETWLTQCIPQYSHHSYQTYLLWVTDLWLWHVVTSWQKVLRLLPQQWRPPTKYFILPSRNILSLLQYWHAYKKKNTS